MSIRDDTFDLNNSGLRGLLRRAMASSEEVYIRILAGGHQGEIVASRPTEGCGPYLHFKRGEGVFEYSNLEIGDARRAIFRADM